MSEKEDFFKAQFGGNPLAELGITPEVLKDIQATGGTEAVRTALAGMHRVLSTAFHPDRTGGETPERFYAATDAIQKVKDLTDGQLDDYVRAFGAKKKGRPANTGQAPIVQSLSVSDPLQEAAIARLSTQILEGSLVPEQLSHQMRFSIYHGQDFPGQKPVIAKYHHAPGQPLILDSLHYANEVIPAINERLTELADAPWWERATYEESSARSTFDRKTRKDFTYATQSVNIDTAGQGDHIVFDATSGEVLLETTELEYVQGAVTVSRTTRTEVQRGTGKTEYSYSVWARSYDTPVEDVQFPTTYKLLGSLTGKYIARAKAVAAERMRENNQASGASFESLTGVMPTKVVNNILYTKFINKVVEAHLNNEQRGKLAEYYIPSIDTGNYALVLDTSKDKLLVLGVIGARAVL